MKMFATRKSLFALVSGAALSILVMGPALAAPVTDGTEVQVTAGTLNVSAPSASAFTTTALTGLRESTSATLDFTITDARGSGSGYNVTATASTFTAPGALVLGNSLLKIGEFTAAVQGGDQASNSPAPEDTGTAVILDAAAQTGVTIMNAAMNTGMGVYAIDDAPLTLTIPADTEIGTYTSTLTIDAASL
jgi:hypothetical protein